MKIKRVSLAVLAIILGMSFTARADVYHFNPGSSLLTPYVGLIPNGDPPTTQIGPDIYRYFGTGINWGDTGTMEFVFKTNYTLTGVAISAVSDLFIDTTGDLHPDWGIYMSGGPGTEGKLVANPTYTISRNHFTAGDYKYAGKVWSGASWIDCPATITGGTATGTVASIFQIDLPGDNPDFELHVILAGINLGGAFNKLTLFKSNGICWNGGQVVTDTNPVPLPPSVLLLGSGIIGLGLLGRWRKTSSVKTA